MRKSTPTPTLTPVAEFADTSVLVCLARYKSVFQQGGHMTMRVKQEFSPAIATPKFSAFG